MTNKVVEKKLTAEKTSSKTGSERLRRDKSGSRAVWELRENNGVMRGYKMYTKTSWSD